jgi:hypothetical protein
MPLTPFKGSKSEQISPLLLDSAHASTHAHTPDSRHKLNSVARQRPDGILSAARDSRHRTRIHTSQHMTSDLTHVGQSVLRPHATPRTHTHWYTHAVCRIVARQTGQATAAANGQASFGHFALRRARTPIGDALRSGDGSFRAGRGLRGVSHDTRWPICQPPSLGPKDTARARSMGLSVPRAQEGAGPPAGCAAATTAVANGRE